MIRRGWRLIGLGHMILSVLRHRKANIDRMERLGLPRPMARELVDAYRDGKDERKES